MDEAVKEARIYVTATGNKKIIRPHHFDQVCVASLYVHVYCVCVCVCMRSFVWLYLFPFQ